MHEMLCMSKASKVVFVAFMQHCIQSTVGHLLMSKVLKGVKYYVLYSVYRASCSSRREGYLKAFHLMDLAVHHQSV